MTMRILVLGGYGAMGRVIVRDLAESGADVIVAGRDAGKARDLIKKMPQRIRKRLQPLALEATDKKLSSKIRELEPDVLVNATWYEFNMHVMRAAIAARVHYIDLGGLYHMTKRQLQLHDKAKKAGVLCLLGMGSTPGITNVMARYGADKLDRIDKIEIRSGSRYLGKEIFQVPFSIRTIMDEFTTEPVVFRNGRVQSIKPMSERVTMRFPKPLGELEGYVTLHSELATFPHLGKGLRNADFAVAYPKSFISVIETLVNLGFASKENVMVGGRLVKPYDFMTELMRKLPAPAKQPEDIDGNRVELWGIKGKKKIRLRYDCIASFHKRWGESAGSVDTGVPASIAAQWLASGKIVHTGVQPPECCVEPLAFFKALRKRGMKITEYENGKARRLN